MPNKNLALYIHWPYCLSKCPYCDFNSHVSQNIDHVAWEKAYIRELDYFHALTADRHIVSIYFGGGTPSLMRPSLVNSVLNHIQKKWSTAPDLEITLEANPTSIEAHNFKALANAGVNRVSIGVQALDAEVLTFLGRTHSPADATNAIEIAQKYFKRYSFDLIYARPGQTPDVWQKELALALTYAQDHISLYQLTIEPGTAFYTSYQRGDFVLPTEACADDLYDLTCDVLAQQNLQAYEVSNFATPGAESRHNLNYWQYRDYIGIGPGAHGRLTIDGKKYAQRQHRAPDIWLDRVKNIHTGLQAQHLLSSDERFQEILLMGLRLKVGIPYDQIKTETGYDFWDKIGLAYKKELELSGDLVPNKDRLILTPQGRKRINTILSYLGV